MKRTIRSFVIRGGRMTDAQQRALENLWPRYGIDTDTSADGSTALDLDAIFGRHAPRTLEIGFGNGDHLASLAARHPERDYLGIEVHRPGVGRLLLSCEAQGSRNVRAICRDAIEVLEQCLAPASIDEVLLLFPDPWHKKRHHKRRIVQPPFVAAVARVLACGGVFRLATDWEPYAMQMLEVLDASAEFDNLVPGGGFAPRDPERAATRFERRGERLGHGVWDLAYRRR
ncbi:MAG TPA: tRNA (guanosine(46)-N7)-methyltransferase TrmB [Steroidobacteraceae bacterium]|jgi:tRNA (guanine-N7-)-methyltransferase|nr:tRNA (guanosine(46)-N7)-methyltransferase TrmB [Steroidobacteraceae bacterium]HNS26531.1 tRNA (guanosine(46)-N7)-methyltransferase TrmB [Steroidobacteraceae bacterium]